MDFFIDNSDATFSSDQRGKVMKFDYKVFSWWL